MKRQKAIFSGVFLISVIILATVGITAGLVSFINSESTSYINSESTSFIASETQIESEIDNLLESDNSATLHETSNNSDVSNGIHGELEIYFFDVGQGDSTLVIFPENKIMLIDAGGSSTQKQLESDLKSLGIDKIDVLVATHPHADHIGGMSYIINSFEIGEIYMPEVPHTSATFEKLLLTISQKGLKVFGGTAGMYIDVGDSVTAQIISPHAPNKNNLNDSSLVIRVTYGETSFIFMGDAEIPAENKIISSGYDYFADVIKTGHHGSSTSSGTEFINNVNPKVAIISVGKDNRYNHPSGDVIERFENIGSNVYRTDIHGTVKITADKNNITVFTSK